MADLTKQKLGDLLVDFGIISNEQLTDALKRQKLSGKRLGDMLIEDGIVTEENILDALEVQLKVERIFLDSISIDKVAVLSIPESLAVKYSLIPILIKGDIIKVVMADPMNIFAIDDVRIASGHEVEIAIASKNDITRYIDKYYSSASAMKAADELSHDVRKKHAEIEESDIDDIKNAPAVRLVDSIIKQAVKESASDVHIEPFERYVRVRNRIDGELIETMRPKKEVHGALVTRIKILGNMNIAEKRLPQDGRILISYDNIDVDLRVSIIPTVHGEKIVIRILRKDSFSYGKETMGLRPDDEERINRIKKNSYGIILGTGPTGSGKTTTLYSILKDLNTPNKNIITIEDPVEYMIEGINQINVNVKAGMTFAAGLRSILRQDPDIIMVGEIRDGETAEIAIRAAITGHIVLSTIHTNDAASTVIRLVDMGIEPFLVASSMVGIISQRLVRKICISCKEVYIADEAEKKILGVPPEKEIKLYKGIGCPFCNGTGYSGRIGVYEIMEISREVRHAIISGMSADDLRDISRKNGMKTLRESCAESVYDGITTIDELIRVAYLKE